MAAGLLFVLGVGITSTGLLWRQTSTQRDAIATLSESNGLQALVGAAATESRVHPTLSLLLAVSAYEAWDSAGGPVPAEVLEQLRLSLQGGNELRELRGHRHVVARSRLTADGRRAVTGSEDGTVCVWDGDASEPRTFDLESPVRDLALLDDGARILCATANGEARIIDVADGEQRVVARQQGSLYAARPLADGAIAVGGDEGVLRIHAADGGLLREYPHPVPLWLVVPHPADPELVATADFRGVVRLFDLADSGTFAVLRGHTSVISGGLSFSQDGKTLLSGATDTTARLWDLTFEGLPILQSQFGSLTRVLFAARRREIVGATENGRVVIWSESGELLDPIQLSRPFMVTSVAIDRAGQRLVMAQYYGPVSVFDLEQRQVVAEWLPPKGDSAYRSVAVDPQGRVVLASNGWQGFPPTLAYTDLALHEPRTIATLEGGIQVNALALSPTGERICLGCSDGSIRAFAPDGQSLPTSVGPADNGVLALGFSPDGGLLGATGVDRTGRIYEVSDDGTLRERCVLRGHEGDVGSIVFSPDGRLLVTASRDGTARIWTTDGALRATIRAHEGRVFDAVFSPDGASILTSGSEGMARFWHVVAAALYAAAKARLHRGWLPDELERYGHLLEPMEPPTRSGGSRIGGGDDAGLASLPPHPGQAADVAGTDALEATSGRGNGKR